MYLTFKPTYSATKAVDTETKDIVTLTIDMCSKAKPYEPCYCGMYLQAITDDIFKAWGIKNPRTVSKVSINKVELIRKQINPIDYINRLKEKYTVIEYTKEESVVDFIILDQNRMVTIEVNWFGDVFITSEGCNNDSLNINQSTGISSKDVTNYIVSCL